MDIEYLTTGDLLVNTAIIKNGKYCLIIDPGNDPTFLIDYLEASKLVPKIILHTHGHFDHIGATYDLVEKYHAISYLSSKDLEIYTSHCNPVVSVIDFKDLNTTPFIDDIKIIETPGHSPGSVSFYFNDLLFSGDTLFCRSIGRSDFYGGDESQIFQSLKKLLQLPKSTKVIPGHGPFTTIEDELRSNIFIKKIMQF